MGVKLHGVITDMLRLADILVVMTQITQDIKEYLVKCTR